MHALQLIALYDYVCSCYTTTLQWQVQRFSPNSLTDGITDEELITIYLYCTAFEEKTKLKSMRTHMLKHWPGWFPKLPAYQTFVTRMNRLESVFPTLIDQLLTDIGINDSDLMASQIGDSMPIITCSHKRAGKVAPELTNKGYCATKKLHYYGAKVHLLAQRRPGTLPLPTAIGLTQASVHDLTAMRTVLEQIDNQPLYLDKAYVDKALSAHLARKGSRLFTPVKVKAYTPVVLRQRDAAADSLFSTAVARKRQPIESLFNWLHQKTGLQHASFVRSEAGLLLHVFGKIAAALVLWMNF
jgi:hypothetical protein